MSLRGPVITLTARPEGPSLMGRVGRVGRVGRMGRVDGDQKCPFNFFIIFRYIDYIYIYIYLLIYEMKIVTNILMGFKI